MDRRGAGDGTPLVLIAHRGESERFPENTLIAFEEAIAGGASIVECDVHLTADNDIIVIHDPKLDRTTDLKGEVQQLSLEQIRQASAGYYKKFGDRFAECRIPLLDEVLDLVHQRARLLIEIKPESVGTERPAQIVTAVVKTLRQRRMLDQIAIISFHWDAVKQCRELCPEILTGILFHRWHRQNPATIAAAVGTNFIIFNKRLITKRHLREMQDRSIPIGAYTVDNAKEAADLYALGVRAIATNRFSDMVEELQSAGWADRLDLSGATFAQR